MPRPKGSKNKKALQSIDILSIEEYTNKIDSITKEIEDLGDTLKSKKAELKALVKAKESAEKAVAEKRADEERKTILAAIEASGKSVDEILSLLKPTE